MGVRLPPETLRKPQDETGGELGLPREIRVQRDEADAGRAGEDAALRVDQRGKEPAVETDADTWRGKQLDATTGSTGKANFVVALSRVSRKAQHTCEKRTNAAVVP